MKFKYREDELLDEFREYVVSTYKQHYASDGIQTMDNIIAKGYERATGFCMGNVDKYGDRYGKKGETPDEWRKDLIKVLHYTLFQLYIHDKNYGQNNIQHFDMTDIDINGDIALFASDLDNLIDITG